MIAWALLGLAAGLGCFHPQPPAGAACSVGDSCPSGLACIEGSCLPPGTVPGSPDAPPGPPDGAIDASADAATPDAAPPDAFVDPTLVAHWQFDDAPGDGALDSSGRGHTAACIAACPTLVAGRRGSGYRFDPDLSHALVVPDHADFRGDFTLAAWFNADAADSQAAIMSKPRGTGTDNSWQLELLDTGRLSVSGGSPHYLESPDGTTAAAWHHVAGTWDGATKRLYVDGVLVASTASTTAYDTHDLVLGGDENSGATVLHWDGVLDDLRIYARALSPAEIEELAE